MPISPIYSDVATRILLKIFAYYKKFYIQYIFNFRIETSFAH